MHCVRPANAVCLGAQRGNMQGIETMTIDERLAITGRAFELLDAGDKEGFNRTMKLIPMPPYLAKTAKDTIGVDFLVNGGWNLSEAEAEFGIGWLAK